MDHVDSSIVTQVPAEQQAAEANPISLDPNAGEIKDKKLKSFRKFRKEKKNEKIEKKA